MEIVQRKCSLTIRNYRIMAIIFGFLSIILVLVLLTVFVSDRNETFINQSYPSAQFDFTFQKDSLKTLSPQYYGYLCHYVNNNCFLECLDMTIQQVIQELNEIMLYNLCDSKIKLVLNNIDFLANTISYGWLQDLNATVTELVLKNCKLDNLGYKTFVGVPFLGSLLSLTISQMKIKILSKETFMESALSSFSLDFAELNEGVLIESDVFIDTAEFLETISLRRCLTSGTALKNITGATSVFKQLRIMDLRNNNLGNLETDTFKNVPNLLSVFLSYCNLDFIHLGAFRPLKNIQQIDLSYNNLVTIKEAVLDDLNYNVEIMLHENPWQCTCDLMWLKYWLIERKISLWPSCKCGDFWRSMQFVEFCPDNDSTTTDMPDINIYKNIACLNASQVSLELKNQEILEITQTATFKKRNIEYIIYHIEDNRYAIEFAGVLLPTDFVIWTNVNDNEDYGCVYNIVRKIEVTLQSGSIYTLCLATNDTSDTSSGTIISNDCTATATEENASRLIWLYSDQKSVVLSITVSVAIGVICISCFITYYFVKHYPRLMKKNSNKKRSSSLKEQSASSLINVTIPNYPNDSNDDVQSFHTNPEGYLTPTLKRWFGHFGRRLDVVSEHGEDFVDDKYCKIYESPPPLPPPNHPLMERRNSVRPYFHSNM